MSLYVNTGKAETDRMISSALKMMSPSVGSLAICTPDVQIPADASYVIVICEGDDFLTSAAHSANEKKLEDAYGVLQYPISLPELIRTVRQVTSAKRRAESDFVFDRERRVVSKNGNSVTLNLAGERCSHAESNAVVVYAELHSIATLHVQCKQRVVVVYLAEFQREEWCYGLFDVAYAFLFEDGVRAQCLVT